VALEDTALEDQAQTDRLPISFPACGAPDGFFLWEPPPMSGHNRQLHPHLLCMNPPNHFGYFRDACFHDHEMLFLLSQRVLMKPVACLTPCHEIII
jgi:hypothetical protein